jgi:tRNA threonylcarbamoyladenosine biosynthesis protein TsaB
MLLLDTCGDPARVGLSHGERVIAERSVTGRSASAAIVGVVRELIKTQRWKLTDLNGVGVVSGPGSFTGVRTGLAAAKGMCEAAGLRLVMVSRLEVLARGSGLREGFAVLGAGRKDLYVRHQQAGGASEAMSTIDDLLCMGKGADVVVAEPAMAELLRELRPRVHELSIGDAVIPLCEAWRHGDIDLAAADANYVRRESELYVRQGTDVSGSVR